LKVIILAGGLGTRFSEETFDKPKPMIELCGEPILVHIMKSYQKFINCEFVVATGYLSDIIVDYLDSSEFKATGLNAVPLYTGEDSTTGARIKHAIKFCSKEETVMATYGDGVSDLDLSSLLMFHNQHGKLATVTAVRPAARFGRIEISDDYVTSFSEKNQTEEGWINGGFFVFNTKVYDYINPISEPLEHKPLRKLAEDRQLMAYKHYGFWQPMDTLREKKELEELIQNNKAPWLS
jgi:glucose-1-phosphate cytidylyltransferase